LVYGYREAVEQAQACRGPVQRDRLIGSRSLWRRPPDDGPSRGDHFYNRIDGIRYDFTAGQFDAPIEYADTTAARADAERGATNAEALALRSAFMRHFGPSE
jgi:hypothetical protein